MCYVEHKEMNMNNLLIVILAIWCAWFASMVITDITSIEKRLIALEQGKNKHATYHMFDSAFYCVSTKRH